MKKKFPSSPNDISQQDRRLLVLSIAVILLFASALISWFGDPAWSTFVASSCGRMGIVLGALWLAWPSLRRPASWLPPGIAVACVISLLVLAARPRLVIVVVPLLISLATLATFIRGFRGQ